MGQGNDLKSHGQLKTGTMGRDRDRPICSRVSDIDRLASWRLVEHGACVCVCECVRAEDACTKPSSEIGISLKVP